MAASGGWPGPGTWPAALVCVVVLLAGCSRFPVHPLTPEAGARVRAERPLRLLVEGAAEPLVLHTPGAPLVSVYRPATGDVLGGHALPPPGEAPAIVLDDPVLAVAAAVERTLREAWPETPLHRETLPAAPGASAQPLPAWTGDGHPFLHLRVVRWMLYHDVLPRFPPPYRLGFVAKGAVLVREDGRYRVLWQGACVLDGAEPQTAFTLAADREAELSAWLAQEGARLREQLHRAGTACGSRLADLLRGAS